MKILLRYSWFWNMLCEVFIYVLFCWLMGNCSSLQPMTDSSIINSVTQNMQMHPPKHLFMATVTQMSHRASRGTVSFFFLTLDRNEKNKNKPDLA